MATKPKHPTILRRLQRWSTTTTAHVFNSFFSRTAWVSRHQKGKTSLGLNEARVLGWQWHQLDHMQTICTSLQTDNHTNTSSLNVYRPDALPDTQPTASKHWRPLQWLQRDNTENVLETAKTEMTERKRLLHTLCSSGAEVKCWSMKWAPANNCSKLFMPTTRHIRSITSSQHCVH